jgi:hypothetical protein
LVVAEHDPFEDRPAFSRKTGRDSGGEPAAQAVAEAGDASTPPHLLPLVHVQDDVYAMTPKPGALVEPVLGPARPPNDGEHLEHGSLRRRAATRELELNALVERDAVEPVDAALGSDVVSVPRRWRSDDDDCSAGTIDLGRERTPIECVEPRAGP